MASMHSRSLDMLLRVAASQSPGSGVIEQRVNTVNDYGEHVATWETLGNVDVISCKSFNVTSNSLQVEKALQVVTQVTVLVVCSYLAAVTNGVRITVNGRVLYVGFSENISGLNKVLNLYCGETLSA